MTDRAKTGLAKFMAAISKVGRGVGVKAPIYMRAAQKAMLECAEAIPCWIMPSWRVSEVLPAEFDFFHLVIIDEASQCDIRELPTIARAKKLLIVGDDRQVSPTAPFIEFKKIVQLKQNYLEEQPFCEVMLPEYSLYDPEKDIHGVRFDGVDADDRAFDDEIGVPLHQEPVFEGARLHLIGVDRQELGMPGLVPHGDGAPLLARRISGAAPAAQIDSR